MRLRYFPPLKLTRCEGSPSLSALGGAVVTIKTSWPGTDHQDNKTNMYCIGQFGATPHVCSYEVAGEDGIVISNILFFPKQDEIQEHYWPVFSNVPPTTLDIRTYNHTILEGKPLTEAENPWQLTQAWADSLLGVLSILFLHILN